MVLTRPRAIRVSALVFMAAVALFAVQDRVFAVAQTSTTSGDWTNTATWVSGTVPAAGDTVTIASGHTVTVSTTVAIDGVTVDGGGALVVTGSLTIGASNLAAAGTVNNTGTLSVTGTLTGAGSLTQGTSATLNLGNALAPTITTLDATTNLPNTVAYNGDGQAIGAYAYSNLTLSGSGTKTGTPTSVSGALTLSGTAAYATPTGLVVGGDLNVQGAALTIPNTVSVTGNTTLSGGTLTITSTSGTKTFSGDITVIGGTWDNDDVTEPVAVSGNITFVSGTFTSGNGVYTLNGAAKTITGPISIEAVTLVSPGSLSIEGAVSIGTLTATATTVTNNGTLTVTTSLTGTGTVINGANRTIHIQSTSAPATGLTFDMTSNTPNTVNYSRNDGSNQAIKGSATYHRLVLSGTGAKTGATGVTVVGEFTLSGSATWTPGTAVVTFLSNFMNNSDAATPVTAVGGSNLNFDTPTPAAATSIGGSSANTLALTVLNFNNTSGVSTSKTITSTTVGVGGSTSFTSNGAFTSTALTVNGGATLTNNATMTSTTLNVNGGTFTNAAAATHTVSGVFTVGSSGLYVNNGTTTAIGTVGGTGEIRAGANSTLDLNNANAPTISTLDLTTNTPNTVTYGGTAQSVRSGSYSHLTLTTSGIKTAAGPLSVSGTFTLTSTAAFTAGAFTHAFSGNWVHDTTAATPLVTTGSTINFNTPSPAGARSITGSAGTTLAFETININNTSGLTLSKPITATGLVTVSGSFTVAAAGTLTISGTGALTIANGAAMANAGTVGITGGGTLTVGSTLAATFTNTGTVNSSGLLDGSGSFLNSANGTLNITNSAAPSITTLDLVSSTPNTVNYSLAGAQTIRAGTYHHLTLSTSGTKTAGGAITVNGTITLAGTASFATTATTHHIRGNWVHGATTTVSAAGGSVVSFEGASAAISGTGTIAFANVSVPSGASVTSLVNIGVSGTFSAASGGTLTLDPSVVVSGAGSFGLASGATLAIRSTLGITAAGASGNVQTTTRTFSTGANYTYNSSGGPQVTGSGLPATVNNLTISNAAGVTLTTSVTVGGALTFTTGPVTPVVSGTTTNGETLSTTDGTWLNAPAFTYQWQRCSPACVDIAGATANTHVLVTADVGSTVRANVTGTYTTAFTVSSAQTATIAAVGGGGGGGGNGGDGGGGGGAPAPTPTPTPTPTAIEEPGIGAVDLETSTSATVDAVNTTTASVLSTQGAMTVSVPAGALPAGAEILIGVIASLPGLAETAPPPMGAVMVAPFLIRATTVDGTPITRDFAGPITLQVTVAAADLPAESTAAMLAFTFWNGTEWVVTPATIVVHPDGSVTLTADVSHFTVFALFQQPAVAWIGTFPRAGVVLAIWRGLTGTEPSAAADLTTSIVTAVWRIDVAAQRFESWVRGAPAFVNRIFSLRSGEPLLLRIGDPPPRTIPVQTPTATPSPTPKPIPAGGGSSAVVQHTVTSADTLSAIGALYNVPWPTIAAANGITGPSYFIHPGQVLTIPSSASTPAPKPTAPTVPTIPSTSGAARTHVVLSTDTLSSIGALYNVPWLTIAAANGITGPSYFIHSGQVLTIPSSASTPVAPASGGGAQTYLVGGGETLSQIGARLGVPWMEIAEANGITGPLYVVRSGQVLVIPGR